MHRTGKTDIERTFDSLHRLLTDRQTTLTHELETKVAETTSKLEEEQHSVNEQLKVLKIRKHFINQLRNTNDHCQILKQRNALSLKFHNVEKPKLPIVEKRLVFQNDKFRLIKTELSELVCLEKRDIANVTWNLSISTGTEMTYRVDHPRGYQFQLSKPINLTAVHVKVAVNGPVIIYILDQNQKLIQKSTGHGTGTLEWVKVPINVELRNSYSVLVWSNNGTFQVKNGNNSLRVVNESCLLESKYALLTGEPNINTVMALDPNTFSIEMEIRVET
ncbi:unnamed protein product [Didymodactylos carnosus]|uniref:Uncharacterized protein n=1 Tax=Didymodactylos carnosus TaxID=1234261 RepID=A0A8S2DIT6_9BILA|nr:unnamed protein product [Didymodactylos carnosus]CAF3750522.1 unnamed protein product [Didymodactylos carnosus]